MLKFKVIMKKKLYIWFHGKLFEFNRLTFRLSTIQVSSAELPLAILIKAMGCVSGRIFTNEIMIPDALNFLFGGSFFWTEWLFFPCLLACTALFMLYRKWCDARLCPWVNKI